MCACVYLFRFQWQAECMWLCAVALTCVQVNTNICKCHKASVRLSCSPSTHFLLMLYMLWCVGVCVCLRVSSRCSGNLPLSDSGRPSSPSSLTCLHMHTHTFWFRGWMSCSFCRRLSHRCSTCTCLADYTTTRTEPPEVQNVCGICTSIKTRNTLF